MSQWLFDVVPSGTTLNTANTVSQDGLVAQQVTASGGTIQSSSEQVHAGDTSARFSGSTSTTIIRLPFNSASQQVAARLYLYRGAQAGIEGFCSLRYSGGPIAHFQITATGALAITLPSGGGSVYSADAVVPANTWTRYEILADTAAGTASCTAYLGDGTTPLGSVQHSALNRTDPVSHLDIGRPSGTATAFTQYFDSVQMESNTTDMIGPYVPDAAPASNTYFRLNGAWLPVVEHIMIDGQWVAAQGTLG